MRQFKQMMLPVLSLVLIAFGMTGLLLLVNQLTAERIQNIMYADLIAAKQEIFGEVAFTREDFVMDGENLHYYLVEDDDGYLFLTSVSGYGGNMVVVVGVNPEGEVVGVQVTEHEETPGLGTRVFDYEFVSQFKVSYTASGFVIGENIDGISGSTMTVDALVLAVNNALAMFREVR